MQIYAKLCIYAIKYAHICQDMEIYVKYANMDSICKTKCRKCKTICRKLSQGHFADVVTLVNPQALAARPSRSRHSRAGDSDSDSDSITVTD